MQDNILSASKQSQTNVTTVGARQGRLLSPTFSNSSSKCSEHDGKASKGGRTIINLRFVDDIDAFTEEEQELEALVGGLKK